MPIFILISMLSSLAFAFPKNFSGQKAPRLTVVFVVDQLRADMTTRQGDLFMPAGTKQSPGGYNFLLKNGMHAPYSSHELLQNMTGPGHAAVSTGSFPNRNGIVVNTWFDHDTAEGIYCVADPKAKIVGSSGVIASEPGMSPKNLYATTLGDELKLGYPKSKVFSVALKDRAAILMAGRRADGVFWFNETKCEWVSSDFYLGKAPLPSYVKDFPKKCEDKAVRNADSVSWASDAAKKIIEVNKLGQGDSPDLLMISISTHDYVGHRYGPSAPQMQDSVKNEDKAISDLLKLIAKKVPGGLDSVVFALTADHGAPVHPDQNSDRHTIGAISDDQFEKDIESSLVEEFGSQKEKYLAGTEGLQIFLRKSDPKHIEFLKKKFQKVEWVDHVVDVKDVLSGKTNLPEQLGRQAKVTLGARSGDLVVIPKPYRFTTSKSYQVEHISGYAYDRLVPLVIFGPGIQKKILWSDVRIIDLAPTLSALLGILPPAMSEGKVLGSALTP